MEPAPDTVLSRVRYYEIDDDLPDYYGDISPTAHDVWMGVELETHDGQVLSLFWINPQDVDGIGYAGHLVAVERTLEHALPGLEFSRYEVGDWPEWRTLVGHRVERVEHIWHPSGPWRVGVRIYVDGRAPVTVALGSTGDSGDVTFVIDNLVVFFDDRAARAYLERLTRTRGGYLGLVVPAADLR